ncbi:hypothetical protein [Longimycelium tulufanense]|uniref:hypothetical protein n=1 Tax=Longimycelium tulufanense TaxID=907463 RepID=UPI00166C6D27|nr:hypothetical protein [Longimycelium tulufanense]
MGSLFEGELVIGSGAAPPSVAQVLSGQDPHTEERKTLPVLVRLSKGVNTPGALPDVLGLTLRIPPVGGAADPTDILFLSSGRFALTRLAFLPALDWTGCVYSTVQPYRIGARLVWLGAFPEQTDRIVSSSVDAVREAVLGQPLVFTIAAAEACQPWRPIGQLVVRHPLPREEDCAVSFDPLLNSHPVLRPAPEWLAAIRAAAYAGSRRARGASLESLRILPKRSRTATG